jgi:phage-related protein (TIGR01555 family)
MGKVLNLFDGLRSALIGTGTSRDARTSYTYGFVPLTQQDIAAAYSGSGLLRKICQIPALDMVREWRTWNGLEPDQVAKVYAEEKRIGLVGLVRQAEVLRALGGGALIMGLPGDPSQPARATDKLAFVHVVSRWHLTFESLQDNPTLEGFGEPEMWTMNSTDGQKRIHPSRVIPFRADRTAALAMPTINSADAFWGESTVSQVLDAVKDSDAARAAFAALLHKAKSMRIGIPNLYEMVAAGKEDQVFARLSILATAESMHNAVVFDNGDDEGKGGEAITDAEYNFAGAKDMLYAYGEFVAAISDIPATRLLGRAPEGMNASGDSQQKDWQKKVRAMQELDLTPCLDRLDPHLLAAAGASPANANATWDPLDTPSEKENAERFKTQMEAIDKLGNLAAIPDEAFNRGVQSLMVEEGYLPELELALSELSDDVRYGIELPNEPLLGNSGANEEGGDLPLAANDGAVLSAEAMRPGDVVEFESDRQTEKGPSAGKVVSIEGDVVTISHSDDTGEVFSVKTLSVRWIGRTHKGELMWSLDRAKSLPESN